MYIFYIYIEHNDEPLTLDHGFPLRVLVPGWVGSRSVKWLNEIILSYNETDLKSYTKSYRMTKDMKHEIRDLPVNSSILFPIDNDTIDLKNNNDDDIFIIKGEAHSGDGRGIVRVDISIDDGKTWNEAIIENDDRNQQNYQKQFHWFKWHYKIKKNDINHLNKLNIKCRAFDSSHNRQPESCQTDLLFNPKGYCANNYHSISVNLI